MLAGEARNRIPSVPPLVLVLHRRKVRGVLLKKNEGIAMNLVTSVPVKEGIDIILTDNAKRHVVTYLSKQVDAIGVRFSVKKTGCSGLSYVVDYIVSPESTDKTAPLIDNYIICIDYKSYPFLKGMVVDYVKQGLNQKFVFDNPNQEAACGCGESFMVKDDNSKI